MTLEESQAENAALRELLAAIRELAGPPRPADIADLQVHYLECVRRLDSIAVYADGDTSGVLFAENRVLVLLDRAQALRGHAALPLRYKAETPASVTA